MKLSIIVITANPTEKEYAYYEALESYVALADEVVIIDGGTEKFKLPDSPKIKFIHIPDPEVWNWAEHAHRLNRALDEASGDWIIKADIDWVFHEADFFEIKRKLWEGRTKPVATFMKVTYYPFTKCMMKGEIPIAINSAYKKRIRFGIDKKTYSDLTYPIFWNGEEKDKHGVPVGTLVSTDNWHKTGCNFWNFDYTFTSLGNAKKKFLRMSVSHEKYFGETTWGRTEDEALKVFLNNMRHKVDKARQLKNFDEVPVFIRERIANLKREEFGFNGWGML